MKNGHARGYAHSGECRVKFDALLRQTDKGKKRVQVADDRLNEEVMRKTEEVTKAEGGDAMAEDTIEDEKEADAKEDKMEAEEVEEVKEPRSSSSGISRDAFGRELRGSKRAAEGEQASPEDGLGDDAEDVVVDALNVHEAISQSIRQGSHAKWESTEEAYHMIRCLQGPRDSVVICERISGKTHDPESRSSGSRLAGTDEIAGPPGETDRSSNRAGGVSKPGESELNSLRSHPGPIIKSEDILKEDQQWHDIGSGTYAKTFKAQHKFRTTTKLGPASCDIHRRTTWSLSTGKMLDDCFPDDVADEVLHRDLGYTDDLRVELVMKDALSMYHRGGADVSEIYSQPRVAQEATVHSFQGQELKPGWSLDLTRNDPKTGEAWDLGCRKVQDRVRKMVLQDKPLFLIGSPPCTPFSTLQNISKHKRDPAIVAEEMRVGVMHLRFCMSLYLLQIAGGRFFIHEHPSRATSWEDVEVVKIAAMEGVGTASVDMCCYGMKVETGNVRGIAKKPTKILSNSAEVLKRIPAKCPNDIPGVPTVMSMCSSKAAEQRGVKSTRGHSANAYVKPLRQRRG